MLISTNLLSDRSNGYRTPRWRHAAWKGAKCYSRPGTLGDGCFRLEEGLLKVQIASTSGEQRIIALLGRGAIVGELSMIDGQPRSASVIALRDSVLCFVSRNAFKQYMAAHPESYQELVSILSSRMREADQAIADAAFLSVKGRVARALLEVAEHVGEHTRGSIMLTHKIAQGDLCGNGRRGAGKRQPGDERVPTRKPGDAVRWTLPPQ